MFTHSLRAVGLLALGAAASLATNSNSAVAQSSDATCFGCQGQLGSQYLEFPTIYFPDGTKCQVRHNFAISSGTCIEDPPMCVSIASCRWKYDVLCIGDGCFDAAGVPRVATGTWTFNGVPVFIQVGCGMSQDLGPIACGSTANVTNIVYAPGAAGGPYLVALSNIGSCSACEGG
jgi:hypothetical protein